ncbi:hypothetical protein L7F22_032481 [Adiantum nelumboides]|nr:hypothetical protein [Adiantum nelumboides]
MNPEFGMQSAPLEHMFQAMSNLLLQVNHTNQTLLSYITTHSHKTAPKIRPKPFSGLPTEGVLTWIDHFDNVAGYHQWVDDRRAMEARTLLKGVAATWFVQQPVDVKGDWNLLETLLIQNFAHQNIMQTTLQQLKTLCQQQHQPVAEFAVKLNQLLLRVDATMSEEMKLFFLWPRLRHDISRRVRDQGPTTFHAAIQIAQRIEGIDEQNTGQVFTSSIPQHIFVDQPPTPMDIDIQNLQHNP